jgi:hypothetical protein
VSKRGALHLLKKADAAEGGLNYRFGGVTKRSDCRRSVDARRRLAMSVIKSDSHRFPQLGE